LFEGRRVSSYFEGAVFGSIIKGSPWFGKVKGLLVYEMDPGSPAWSSGLRKGDVIVSINRKTVESKSDMAKALNGAGDSILLNLRRGNRALFTVIQ
ncbi:PDZ domain-containing protein, partial [Pseudomonadota bacterium]